jgi:hypothetical protein
LIPGEDGNTGEVVGVGTSEADFLKRHVDGEAAHLPQVEE